MDLNAHNPSGHRFRVLKKDVYGFIQVVGIALAAMAQVIEGTVKDKIFIGICLATLVSNLLVATWLFSQTGDIQLQHKGWKTLIFKLTGVLSIYFAFALLLPELFAWIGLAVICTIMILIEGRDILRSIFDWSCKKTESAINYTKRLIIMFTVKEQIQEPSRVDAV